MIPVLVRDYQLSDICGINIKLPHISKEKTPIPSGIEKKGFMISFNKSCKTPACCEILIGFVVVDNSKPEHGFLRFLSWSDIP